MTTTENQIRSRFVTDRRQVSLRQMASAAGAAFERIVTTLLDWQGRARQRRQVLGLSDRALQDFGSNRAEAERHGDKPFWHS